MNEDTHKRRRDDDLNNNNNNNTFDIVPSFPNLNVLAQCSRSSSSSSALSKKTSKGEKRNDDDHDDNEEEEDIGPVMLSGDELTSDDESDTEVDEAEVADEQGAPSAKRRRLSCVCCDLATSEVVKKMNMVQDSLAGRAGDGHITDMQLAIYDKRMAPLRAEGRDVPKLTRAMLTKHYRTHRVSIMRSVAEEIRIFELMERTLRRTGLCDMDADGRKVLVRGGAQEMNRLSKSKLDLLKFYATLEKQRREDEANATNPS